MRRPPLWVGFGVGVGLVGGSFLGLGPLGMAVGEYQDQARLADHGVAVTGTYAGTGMHAYIAYRFDYDGRTYDALGPVATPNPDRLALRPGASLYITIDPAHPSAHSCACRAQHQQLLAVFGWPLALSGGAGIFLGTSAALIKRRRPTFLALGTRGPSNANSDDVAAAMGRSS